MSTRFCSLIFFDSTSVLYIAVLYKKVLSVVSNYFIGDKYLCYDGVEKLPYQRLQSILFCDVMSSTMDVYQRQLSKP